MAPPSVVQQTGSSPPCRFSHPNESAQTLCARSLLQAATGLNLDVSLIESPLLSPYSAAEVPVDIAALCFR